MKAKSPSVRTNQLAGRIQIALSEHLVEAEPNTRTAEDLVAKTQVDGIFLRMDRSPSHRQGPIQNAYDTILPGWYSIMEPSSRIRSQT